MDDLHSPRKKNERAPTHLCQDLPCHDDDLHGLEWYVLRQALDDSPLPAHAGLPRHQVRDRSSCHQQDHHGEDDRDCDATGAVFGALAATKAQLFRVPLATNAAIYRVQNRKRATTRE